MYSLFGIVKVLYKHFLLPIYALFQHNIHKKMGDTLDIGDTVFLFL